MHTGQTVPEDLAAGMLPGPRLAAALADLHHTLVPNDEIIEVLEAQSRQLAHEQARMFEVMNEVLHRHPTAPGLVRRGPTPAPYGADEVRAAMAWSRRFADRETDLAYILVEDLPQVQQALLEGRIDRGKAAVFAEHLATLSTAQARAICQSVLPKAPGWTPWQIGDRIKKLILQLDPRYYARRYAKALRDRRVLAYLDAHGAAVITASGLPAEDAAAAVARVDQLARAARRAGHPSTLDQVRADVFLGLLDGSLHGLSRDGIIAALLQRAHGADEPAAEGTVAQHGTTAPSTTTPEAAAPAPGDLGDLTPTPGAPGDLEPGDPEPGDLTCCGPPPGDPRPADPKPDDPEPDDPTPADTAGTDGNRALDGDRAPTVGVEIRVPLATLLGHDDHPAEIPGWGPVTADTARTLVARQRRAEWRWVVLDPDGRWLSDGITRRRPTDHPHTDTRGGIVELQIPETLLTDLQHDPAHAGAWASVIADIAAQHADRDRRAQDLDAHPDRRYPRAGLRRHVQIRDRYCVFKGCRTPARAADQDHTHDHSRGGPTIAADLGPACRHDHMLKTEGGWHLHQPEPGVFVWTSPLGRRYPVRPEPILPPPVEPVIREPDPQHDEPADPTERPLNLRPDPRAPPSTPAPRHLRPTRLDWERPGEPSDIDGAPPF